MHYTSLLQNQNKKQKKRGQLVAMQKVEQLRTKERTYELGNFPITHNCVRKANFQ